MPCAVLRRLSGRWKGHRGNKGDWSFFCEHDVAIACARWRLVRVFRRRRAQTLKRSGLGLLQRDLLGIGRD
jgi:hypothetical protein